MNFQKRRLYFVFFQKPKCRDGKEILENKIYMERYKTFIPVLEAIRG